MLVLWNPSPPIRSKHTVAHTFTEGQLYLHSNHLITPFSISPHNWMKRRSRSVTLVFYFMLNICVLDAAGRRKCQHSQLEQRTWETKGICVCLCCYIWIQLQCFYMNGALIPHVFLWSKMRNEEHFLTRFSTYRVNFELVVPIFYECNYLINFCRTSFTAGGVPVPGRVDE